MAEDHTHCVSCVSQRCTVRPSPGVSCELIPCPLACGHVFHACKRDEHRLLCQLERVPCLNSGFGCPVTLVRNQMSPHLVVCPAGAVCCTMEWNRWPVKCLDYTSYENLSRAVEEVEQLDMALALQDQRTLIETLKVIPMTPTKNRQPAVPQPAISGTNEKKTTDVDHQASKAEQPAETPPSQVQPPEPGSAKEKIANGINGLKEEHLSNLYEATVEMARSLAVALDIFSTASTSGDGARANKRAVAPENGPPSVEDQDWQIGLQDRAASAAADVNVCRKCSSSEKNAAETQIFNGPAPPSASQHTAPSDGDQEDVVAAASRDEQSSLLISPPHVLPGQAQRAGHVILEDRGLVLLENRVPEPKFQTFTPLRDHGFCPRRSGRRNFIAPSSSHKPRPPMEDKAVDTGDLEQVDDPMGLGEIDLITAALFFCLEESRESRRISDTVYVDSRHVDFGTQTFTFPAAILVTNTRVGDMASASACDHASPQLSYPSPYHTLRLGLVLEVLEVGLEAVPHNRYLPNNPRYHDVFPFICGQSFRRDQFSSHFTNVHGDIHAGLNGWMEHRCPMAYYGCTYSQRRFYPSTKGAKIVHDKHLRSFGVQQCPGLTSLSASEPDRLSGLPVEILLHIAGLLDSFSLCQLSMVSRTMREVCASLLQTKGIVELQWERQQGPNGRVSWTVKNKVWRFSTAFSSVLSWGFSDLPSMSNHLKKCQFNTVQLGTEPVPLPVMCSARDGHSLRRPLRHVNAQP